MDSRRLVATTLALLSILTISACGGGGGGGPTGPGGGGGGGGNAFTAVIDGVNWASDASAISVSGNSAPTREGMLIITGHETSSGRSLSLAISFLGGPAVQPLGVNTGTTPGGSGTVIVAPNSWLTPFSGAAGLITLTERTATRIVGTFNFTAAALASATPAQRVVTGGAFDITVAAGLPPLPTGVGSTVAATIGGAPWYAATVVGLNSGSGVFSLSAGNTAYSLTFVPKVPVSAGNTYGIPSQMAVTALRDGSTDSWWGGLGADIGSVTVSTFGADRLVATFNGVLVPLNAAAGLSLAGGAINAHLQ
jgi:hypothetical protein